MQYEIEKLYATHGRYEVIFDWLKVMALSLKQATNFFKDVELEKDYLATLGKYEKNEQECFVIAFRQLVDTMNADIEKGIYKDWLGDFYMNAGIRDKDKQQEFTPYSVAKLLAEGTLSLELLAKNVKEKGFATFNDPCVGGGCLPIAYCDTLKNRFKFDYQRKALIVCNDNDIKCVYMAFIQLTLIGAPARVLHQDTLTQKVYSIWDNPPLCAQWNKFRSFLERRA